MAIGAIQASKKKFEKTFLGDFFWKNNQFLLFFQKKVPKKRFFEICFGSLYCSYGHFQGMKTLLLILENNLQAILKNNFVFKGAKNFF